MHTHSGQQQYRGMTGNGAISTAQLIEVKFTLEQAATKAQMGSRGISLLFL
jgi:hypothetical protein